MNARGLKLNRERCVDALVYGSRLLFVDRAMQLIFDRWEYKRWVYFKRMISYLGGIGRRGREKKKRYIKNEIQGMKIYQCCFRVRSMIESSLTRAVSLNASSLAILASYHLLFVAAFVLAISLRRWSTCWSSEIENLTNARSPSSIRSRSLEFVSNR